MLSKDVLGQLKYDALQPFCNRTMDDLIAEYGTLDAIRLAAAKAEADAIVTHFTTSAVIPAGLLVAPPGGGAVTGQTTIE